MSDIPSLWNSAHRKEALDLLVSLWPMLSDNDQAILSSALVSGPPARLNPNLPEAEREASRDRRVFDRIAAMEHAGHTLSGSLVAERDRLVERYPNWQWGGEQSHFGVYTQVRWGSGSDYTVEALLEISDEELQDLLLAESEDRDGLLDAWRQFASRETRRTLSILSEIGSASIDHADFWSDALWGLRDATKDSEQIQAVLALIANIDSAMLRTPRVSSAASNLLEAIASNQTLQDSEGPEFWRVFDLVTTAASFDPSNADQPGHDDWVSLSINRSLGTLATTFLGVLFSRRLLVGAGIPEDLVGRLNVLLSPEEISHRPARVIAASRLSYLFAVDPDWSHTQLLPSFDWMRDEEEAVASWQGFSWQPRFDPLLWQAIKHSFLASFTTDRISRLGEQAAGSMAQLLAVVVVELGMAELPRNMGRAALAVLGPQERSEALSWIAAHMQRPIENEDSRSADSIWHDNVSPWLRRSWPLGPDARSASESRHLAEIAIATQAHFESAVHQIVPLVVPSDAGLPLEQLANTNHPEQHPAATLDLVTAILDPNQLMFVRDALRAILGRIQNRHPSMIEDHRYRHWNDRLRVHMAY
ncbi:hypothetical protein FB548_2250 [Pseudoxanthomonas sp. 3HH-4]|uniref:hypothetical protein n=1 Tax=Pseudoxanthomonas sp. 3HH-4 TaxID=1690214 RepID=UPI001151B0CD|nr:hypothetical protein [Pseudoxanthomonas sp. 3HH-4]TQM12317.1 hypothetical protein FB548_2250 [Pseudoxanthomonas sp. 3HH-4]